MSQETPSDSAGQEVLAHVEVRHEGEHSTAEATATELVRARPAALDALVAELRGMDLWAEWSHTGPGLTIAALRDQWAYLLAPASASDAEVPAGAAVDPETQRLAGRFTCPSGLTLRLTYPVALYGNDMRRVKASVTDEEAAILGAAIHPAADSPLWHQQRAILMRYGWTTREAPA